MVLNALRVESIARAHVLTPSRFSVTTEHFFLLNLVCCYTRITYAFYKVHLWGISARAQVVHPLKHNYSLPVVQRPKGVLLGYYT